MLRRFASQASQQKKTNYFLWIGAPLLAAGVGGLYALGRKDIATKVVPTEYVPALNGEWRDFKVTKVAKASHNVAAVTFALPEGTTDLGLPVAAAILTKFTPPGAEKPIIRPYTPVEPESGSFNKEFQLVVKSYPDGKMSRHIHSLKVGDSLTIKGPSQKYKYEPNKEGHIGMVAGGSGITPMLQVIQKIALDPSDTTKVDLIFSNVEEKDIFLRTELDYYASKKPGQIKVHYKLDKPTKGFWGVPEGGFIDEPLLAKCMPKPGKGKIFVCGPPGQVAAICGPKGKNYTQGDIGGLLAKMGYTIEEVFKF
ncbi:NADH-cytochrome b5 reductase [Kappamyces sp. JEL0829]|nr:NADH-cytochrome b5 reductase [Kappamyces sp. JEL0829]KAJ3359173.1 NADH-cytochrome b5 reductase [Kappamyces sp. JEL0680]